MPRQRRIAGLDRGQRDFLIEPSLFQQLQRYVLLGERLLLAGQGFARHLVVAELGSNARAEISRRLSRKGTGQRQQQEQPQPQRHSTRSTAASETGES